METVLTLALLVADVIGALAGPRPDDPHQSVHPERVAHVPAPTGRPGADCTASTRRSRSGQTGAAAGVGDVCEGTTGSGAFLVGRVGTAIVQRAAVQFLALGARLRRCIRRGRRRRG